VELVEHPQLRGGEFATEDALAVFGDIPVQVSRLRSGQAFGEGCLADLARSGHENHLLGEVASDLRHQVPGERGHEHTV